MSSTAAAAPSRAEFLQPAIVDIIPDRIFAPLGFDDNDNAQVILDGRFPNTCYKIGPTQLRIDNETHKIYVRQQAFFYPGAWCAEVSVSYAQTVNLGILSPGKYDIIIDQRDRSAATATSLPIAVATSVGPDDHLYAPITDAHIQRGTGLVGGDEEKIAPSLVLNGYFSSSCMTFQTVNVNVRPNNVIEVLPIVEMRDMGCTQITTDFSVIVALDKVPPGRYLIHIRSLNGQAINQVVEL